MALSPPAHLAEDLGHLEGTRGVHVGSDDGDAIVCLFGVAECERSLQVNLKPQETEAQSETVTKLFSFQTVSQFCWHQLNIHSTLERFTPLPDRKRDCCNVPALVLVTNNNELETGAGT